MPRFYHYIRLVHKWKETTIGPFQFCQYYLKYLKDLYTLIVRFLDKHNLITITQSGFRKLHSTVTALLNVTDKWLRNIDNGLVTGVVFTDLHKAFNTVDINILLSKLSLFGIYGVELQWFMS